MTCPECKGTGKVALFTSVEECRACKKSKAVYDGGPQNGCSSMAKMYIEYIQGEVKPPREFKWFCHKTDSDREWKDFNFEKLNDSQKK